MPKDKPDAAQGLRLMPCQAGGRSYYLDASAVRSVHRKDAWRLNWRGGSPLGWVREQGEEVPILDLARALGLSHTVVVDNAVVVDGPNGLKAWGVGPVGRVVSLPEDRILAVPGPCWTEDSPPWLGVVTGEGTQALCVSPQLLGEPGATAGRAGASWGAEPAPSSGKPTGRAILFHSFDGYGRVPGYRFCIGFAQVAEFITTPRLVPVPAGQPWLLGLLVWRNRGVPVIDLGWGVRGWPTPGAETEDFLIVRATVDGKMAAVPVFGKPDGIELPIDCLLETDPPAASPAWFRRCFKRENEYILTPDFTGILAVDRP